MANKEELALVIVESPTKAKTIKQFLPGNFKVMASVGHICEIKNTGLYNMGIDVKGNFNIDFDISKDKKDVVKDLKSWVEKASVVYVAADLDREGEAIAYHLKNFLKIPDSKFKRVKYHEVTKKAVLEAIDNPVKLDLNLVNAALSRASLDKIIGFRLSPISRTKVGAKSIGRCQSPALRLVVDREEEIQNFKPEKYFEIWLPFSKDKVDYKAQYKGLIKEDKNTPTIKDEELAKKIIEDCKGFPYTVHNIECKDRIVQTKQPFITSTYQQEVSSKLGYSVKQAMNCAQQLFEGINIGGQHVGLCTYIRTDDPSMAPEFKEEVKKYIVENFGEKYLAPEKKEKKKKNSELAQEAHECLRVTDLKMTPEIVASYIGGGPLLKVYTLIYNRTIASLMADAIITDVNFIIKNGEYKFVYSEHSCKFDGFRKVYNLDDEELKSGLDVCTGEKLKTKKLELLKKETSPPRRFSEATLVSTLEKNGIGRPSTMATIISTLLDKGRGYCEEQGKVLVPTELGIRLIHFMKEAFPEIIDYNYTSNMEENLDHIAKGELDRVDYLKDFYKELEDQIKDAKVVEGNKPKAEELDRVCPQCGKQLVKRHGRYGDFIACTGYPKCNYTEKV